jgi:hypothetical protein
LLSKQYQTRRRRRGWHENLTKTFFVEYRDYNTEGKDTRHVNFVVMMAAVLAVLLAAGCTSAPVKETSTTNVSTAEPPIAVKYVELGMVDGTKVGGKYVSESAAFTTIVPMYVINENGIMSRGNGKETGITTSLIATVITIEDPSSLVETTLNEQAIAEKAYKEKRAAEDAETVRKNYESLKH